MASTTCWRCMVLHRPSSVLNNVSIQVQTQKAAPAAAFSTSAVLSNLPMKKMSQSARMAAPKKGNKQAFQLKKKRGSDDTPSRRTSAVGERKALRKRVILSNINAFEVPDMVTISPDTPLTEAEIGKVMSLPNNLVDQLRAMEAFKHTQGWSMFKRPSILIREDLLELQELIAEPIDSEAKRDVTRRVIVGERTSGKSVYLLQAMMMAFMHNWTVIHIPEVRDLTIAGTDYSPIPGTDPLQYAQKNYTAALLQRIAQANPGLKNLQITTNPNLPIPVQENLALDRLCNLGSADPEIAQQVFEAVWAELVAPGRPPVLVALDNFSRANELSEYRSATFERIHAHDIYLISWFLGLLSGRPSTTTTTGRTSPAAGRSALPNGGIVLAATSGNNAVRNRALELRLAQIEAHQQLRAGTYVPPRELTGPYLEATDQESQIMPQPDRFFRYDTRVLDVFGGPEAAFEAGRNGGSVGTPIEVKRVGGVSKGEARGLMEYWAKSGMFKQAVTEQLVSQKWTLSGGGVLGELEKGCVGVRI